MFAELRKTIPAWLLNTAIIFFIIILISGITFFIWEGIYKDKIFPGVRIAGIDMSGKTAEEAEKNLNRLLDSFDQKGIDFKYKNKTVSIFPASASADSAYALIKYEVGDTVDRAIAFGRSKNIFSNFKDQLSAFILGERVPIDFTLDKEGVTAELVDSFSSLEPTREKSSLSYDETADEFVLKIPKASKVIEYPKAINLLEQKLSLLDFTSIQLTSAEKNTDYGGQTERLEKEAAEYLALSPLSLINEKEEWLIEKQKLAALIDVTEDQAAENLKLGLNKAETEKFLKETISSKIDIKPQETRFQIKGGRVTEFQTGRDGIELNIAGSIQKIENEFFNNKSTRIELIVEKKPNPTAAGSTENLMIKEIIGTGHSNFAGSPKNRRINIRVGANSLNGLLIKPGETFSIMKALGKIDASNGYLEELVIKGSKTIPEFGGGLCQIGTTLFRSALASGLPINERHNHSYRVSYYEPAGTDATLYDPSPDLKFTNDTGNYVLIQTRISGNDLYFDLWGTKDGRIINQTYPTIYNIVKPKPTKIIETLDLPAGKKKCTEKAHNGADAYFDYKVTYPDGKSKDKRFSSHYVPWQEVCLIGVEKFSTTTAAVKATSSPSNIIATSTPASTNATSTR